MRKLLLAGAAVACLSLQNSSAHAIACSNCTQELGEFQREVVRLANVAEQIRQAKMQVDHLLATYQSLAHAPAAELQSLMYTLEGFRDVLPEAADEIAGLLGGTSLGSLGGEVQGFLDRATVYAMQGDDALSQRMRASASSIAGTQALLSKAYQNTAEHSRALRGIEGQLRASPDAKSTADLQARAAVEQAYIQSQNGQIAALSALQHSQVRSEQVQSEQLRRCQIDEAIRQLNAQGAGIAVSGAGGSCTVAAGSGAVAGAGYGAAGEDGVVTPATYTAGTDGAAGGTGEGFVASNYSQFLGQSVGSGQCVALVQAASPEVGLTKTWTQGEQVQGNTDLKAGTVIATFDADGTYGNHTDGTSHTAIYLGQNENGIQVQDQWAGKTASVRTIRWSGGATKVNQAGNYYVVTH